MLNFGMPAGFAEALAMKYGIMKMQADAQSNALNSSANLDSVKAGLLPRQTAADIGETQARTAGQLETNKFIGPLANSAIDLQKAQGSYYGAEAGSVGQDVITKKNINKQRGFGLGAGGSNDNNYGFGGYGFSFSQ